MCFSLNDLRIGGRHCHLVHISSNEAFFLQNVNYQEGNSTLMDCVIEYAVSYFQNYLRI